MEPSAEHSAAAKRPALVAVRRTAVPIVLIITVYYLIPVEPGQTGALRALRIAGTVAGLAAVTWLILRQVSRHFAAPEDAPLVPLLTALVGGIAFFALADYVVAVANPHQFVDLRTKTDALYFALATLTTVGYGDVHATGQVARGIVTVQLVFNVMVIATGASVLTRQVGARIRRRGRPPE
jgi:hypothetical protein